MILVIIAAAYCVVHLPWSTRCEVRSDFVEEFKHSVSGGEFVLCGEVRKAIVWFVDFPFQQSLRCVFFEVPHSSGSGLCRWREPGVDFFECPSKLGARSIEIFGKASQVVFNNLRKEVRRVGHRSTSEGARVIGGVFINGRFAQPDDSADVCLLGMLDETGARASAQTVLGRRGIYRE